MSARRYAADQAVQIRDDEHCAPAASLCRGAPRSRRRCRADRSEHLLERVTNFSTGGASAACRPSCGRHRRASDADLDVRHEPAVDEERGAQPVPSVIKSSRPWTADGPKPCMSASFSTRTGSFRTALRRGHGVHVLTSRARGWRPSLMTHHQNDRPESRPRHGELAVTGGHLASDTEGTFGRRRHGGTCADRLAERAPR